MIKYFRISWIYILCIVITGFLVSSNQPGPGGFSYPPGSSNIKLPIPGQTIWGSSSAPFPGETISRVEAWKRLNEKIKSLNGGYALQARRTYDRGIPISWSASSMAEDAGLTKVSIGSIKPDWTETANGNNYETIKNFVKSIPEDRIVYLAFHHEPEDNVKAKGHSTALLQAAFGKFVDAVLAAGKPNVHPCFVLMSYTFRPESGRNPAEFNMAAKVKPEQLKQVIAGVDGYAKTPEIRSAETLFEPCMTVMASWGFSRFGIFETATQTGTTPGLRAKWIEGLASWVKKRGNIELVSWFHSGVGPHAGTTGWFLGNWSKNGDTYSWKDEDGSVAAYAKLLRP